MGECLMKYEIYLDASRMDWITDASSPWRSGFKFYMTIDMISDNNITQSLYLWLQPRQLLFNLFELIQ